MVATDEIILEDEQHQHKHAEADVLVAARARVGVGGAWNPDTTQGYGTREVC